MLTKITHIAVLLTILGCIVAGAIYDADQHTQAYRHHNKPAAHFAAL